MIKRLRDLRDDESGAMLVFALIIITTVALVTGAVLSHGGTNFRATVALRGVAGTAYAGDAAGKTAINDLRLGSDSTHWTTPSFPGPWADWVYTNSADGTGCFGAAGAAPDNTLELNGIYPATGDQTAATSARVECSVVPGTGIFGAGGGVGIDDPDPTNAFARALTTIGTSGAWQGMTLKPLGTGNTAAMPIRGGVASKSYVDAQSGALVTDGYVKAEGACIGVIVSNPAKQCNAAGAVPIPSTPASPLSSVPGYQDASTQACTFEPGFYNDAEALSDATAGCNPARFASGKYYFDFHDEDQGTGDNAWLIDTRLIGGEYVGGDIPGACRSPILNDPVAGVQFVFGGTSRIELGDGAHVELCGPSNGGEAPMTLNQNTVDQAIDPIDVLNRPAQNLEDLGVADTNDKVDPFTVVGTGNKQSAISAADANAITWVATKNSNRAELDLRNFNGLDAIPVGSTILSADVRVKYVKAPGTPALTVDVAGTTTPLATVPAVDGTGWAEVAIEEHLRELIASGAFSGTRPVIELRLPGTSKDLTLTIDAVELSLSYVPPALRTAEDSVFIGLRAGSNFAGEFVVQGATWAPHGYVALDPGSNNNALVAFRWGLVALGVDFKAQPSQTFGYPLVSIPDPGHGLGPKVTVVDLEIWVCVEAGSCASGGTHALTARVMITDPPYGASGAPVPGRRRIEVLSWSEQK